MGEQNKNKHNMLWLRLNKMLEERNMSQRELARQAGIGKSTIPEIKRGNIKKPSFELICKLADGLAIDINEFRDVIASDKEIEKE